MEQAIESKPVERFSQGQRRLEGCAVGGDTVGEPVAFGHPPLEICGRGQEVVGLISARPHGADQIQGGVPADECECHVTILTGDDVGGNIVTC